MSASAHLIQMFDSTIVRTHVAAAGAKGGKRGERSGARAAASDENPCESRRFWQMLAGAYAPDGRIALGMIMPKRRVAALRDISSSTTALIAGSRRSSESAIRAASFAVGSSNQNADSRILKRFISFGVFARRFAVIVSTALAFAPCAALAGDGFAGLGGEANGFLTPIKRPLVFPADFGAHPGFRIEWWYLTANLKDADGASYGVQWTLFRQALEPGPERDGWSSQIAWLGHAAVTSASEHLFAEARGRGGIGQAGVAIEPFKAWIDDWSLEATGAQTGLSRLRVSAAGPGFRYQLALAADRPLVLHGENGLSRKSERGQASYYYSQPFFEVEGTLIVHDREVKVSGQAWMDHEWSSQPLAPDQKGWDWFSLHLDGGEALMLFRLRSDAEPAFRAGTWIAADGAPQPLVSEDIVLEPLGTASIAGLVLPQAWRLRVKSRVLDIRTSSLNANSLMATSFQYWEGPITFQGSHTGVGYLEMTGY
jgi:predicted secreted hydrolase